MCGFIGNLLRDESGVTAIEYVTLIGTQLSGTFMTIATKPSRAC